MSEGAIVTLNLFFLISRHHLVNGKHRFFLLSAGQFQPWTWQLLSYTVASKQKYSKTKSVFFAVIFFRPSVNVCWGSWKKYRLLLNTVIQENKHSFLSLLAFFLEFCASSKKRDGSESISPCCPPQTGELEKNKSRLLILASASSQALDCWHKPFSGFNHSNCIAEDSF